jgi:hypothetical protein
MTNGILMTPQQIADLVAEARSDAKLWAMLKERELENERICDEATKQGVWPDDRNFIPSRPPLLPTLGMLIDDLIVKRFGANSYFITPIIPLRRELRIDLGLPV